MWYLIVSIPDLCTLTYFVKCHIGDETWKISISTKEDLVQLIIDIRKCSNLFDNSDIILETEKHSRNLCYNLYNKRLSLLCNNSGRCLLIWGNIFLIKITALKPQTILPCYQGCSYIEEACILMFLSAMPRGVSVAHIYVLKLLLHHL